MDLVPAVGLPFTGLILSAGLAVDTAENVYITGSFRNFGGASLVLKLPAGSSTQVELPFTGGSGAKWEWVAVDRTGNVYVTDQNSHVLKLPAG